MKLEDNITSHRKAIKLILKDWADFNPVIVISDSEDEAEGLAGGGTFVEPNEVIAIDIDSPQRQSPLFGWVWEENGLELEADNVVANEAEAANMLETHNMAPNLKMDGRGSLALAPDGAGTLMQGDVADDIEFNDNGSDGPANPVILDNRNGAGNLDFNDVNDWKVDEFAGCQVKYYEDNLSRHYLLANGSTCRMKLHNVALMKCYNNPYQRNVYANTETYDIRFLVVLVEDIFEEEIERQMGVLMPTELNKDKLAFIKGKGKLIV